MLSRSFTVSTRPPSLLPSISKTTFSCRWDQLSWYFNNKCQLYEFFPFSSQFSQHGAAVLTGEDEEDGRQTQSHDPNPGHVEDFKGCSNSAGLNGAVDWTEPSRRGGEEGGRKGGRKVRGRRRRKRNAQTGRGNSWKLNWQRPNHEDEDSFSILRLWPTFTCIKWDL